VQDYLKSRRGQWDGVPRINSWIDHVILAPGRAAGVKQDVNEELCREYAQRFFIALVARAMKPGCQVDTMLILVGPEGFRKSTIFKRLMPPGLEDMYVIQSINYRNPVEGERYLSRFWLVEDAEMTGAGSNEQKKSFIAASHGSIRSMYDNNVTSAPRKCVLVGTTNEYDLLTDPTGNRRYWMVPCPVHQDRPITHPSQPKADTDWLSQNLDQLYSEAVELYFKGERWHLSAEHEQARTADARSYRAVSDLQAMADAVYARNGGGRDNGLTLTEFAKAYDPSQSMTAAKIHADRNLFMNALKMAGFVTSGKHPKNKRTLWCKMVEGHTQPGMNGLYDRPSEPDLDDSSDA
jgi:predicted P-loop ATPase